MTRRDDGPRLVRGLSLIELMIVVGIMAILAALVVPKYVGVSQETSEAAIRSQLQRIRGQLEVYRVDRGAYPALIADQWVDLVNGDYLQAVPRNPLNDSTVVAGAPGPGVGWVWRDKGNGTFGIFGTDGTQTAEFAE